VELEEMLDMMERLNLIQMACRGGVRASVAVVGRGGAGGAVADEYPTGNRTAQATSLYVGVLEEEKQRETTGSTSTD